MAAQSDDQKKQRLADFLSKVHQLVPQKERPVRKAGGLGDIDPKHRDDALRQKLGQHPPPSQPDQPINRPGISTLFTTADPEIEAAKRLLFNLHAEDPHNQIQDLRTMVSEFQGQSDIEVMKTLIKCFRDPAILGRNLGLYQLLNAQTRAAIIGQNPEVKKELEKQEEAKQEEDKKEKVKEEASKKYKAGGSTPTKELTPVEIFTEKYGEPPKTPPPESILNQGLNQFKPSATQPQGKAPVQQQNQSASKNPLPSSPRTRPAAKEQESAAEKFAKLYGKAPTSFGGTIFGPMLENKIPTSGAVSSPTTGGGAQTSGGGSSSGAPGSGSPSGPSSGGGNGNGGKTAHGLPRKSGPKKPRPLNLPIKLATKTTKKWLVIILIVFLLFLFIFQAFKDISTSISLLPRSPSCLGSTGNISACQFYRGDDKPAGASFTSNLLMRYFNEVSLATGIPASILAGITRIESPGSVNYSDQKISSMEATPLADCDESPTGALGLTQVQPAGTTGHSEEGAKIGASYLGRNVNSLTHTDYCNPHINLYLGAGVILAKLGATKWDPSWNNKDSIYKLAYGYYGCDKYPSCTNGPYSYGGDLWNSFSNCSGANLSTQSQSSCYCGQSSTTAIASCPVLGGTIKTPSYTADSVHGHCSQGYQNGNGESGCSVSCPSGGLTTSRRAKAIDVFTNGKDVILPTVSGQTVSWKFAQHYTDHTGQPGNGYIFQAKLGSDTWTLDVFHMDQTPLQMGSEYPSGTAVGKTLIDHVHTTIGKNLKDGLTPKDVDNDCDPGWFPSDFMCGGPNLTNESNLPSNPGNDTSPSAGTSFEIGKSVKGNPITVYQLGSGSNVVAIIGGMNGVAEQSGIDMVNIAYNVFGQQGSGYNIPPNTTVYFLPLTTPGSPDGFNAAGVDINRNFDSTIPGGEWNQWGCSQSRYATAGGTATSCSGSLAGQSTKSIFPTYCAKYPEAAGFSCAKKTGNSPYDQPETQAVKNLISSKHVKTVLSYRAPFNDVTSSNDPDHKLAGSESLAQNMAKWLGIPYDPYFPKYPVTGQFMDWLQDQGVVGVETELRTNPKDDAAFRKTNLDAIQNALNGIAGGAATASDTSAAPGACTGPALKFTFYCQGDTQWLEPDCHEPGGFGQFGCGPTSLAMVLSSFGTNMTPKEVDEKVMRINKTGGIAWRACNSGSYEENALLDKTWLPPLGFVVSNSLLSAKGNDSDNTSLSGENFDLVQAQKYLSDGANGSLIIASSDEFPVHSGAQLGHIVVVQTVDAVNNRMVIRDPANCAYNTNNGAEFVDGRDFMQTSGGTIYKLDAKGNPILGKPFRFRYAYAIRKGAPFAK